ncbi:MAG: hypothetical protein KDN22_06445 [Verrucomicrobiae bacterium]|nr:hypothetical protein [Verrucomicrobiae bacterium]
MRYRRVSPLGPAQHLLEFVKGGKGGDAVFFVELRKAVVSFVIRIRNKPRFAVGKELPLGDADRATGVMWQGMVKVWEEGNVPG